MFLLGKVYCVPIGGYSQQKFKLYCSQCKQYINTEPLHSTDMLNWAGCLIQSHFYDSFDGLEDSLSFADRYNYGSFPIHDISTNDCKSIGSKAFTRKLLNSIVEDNKIAKSDLDQT